MNPYASYANRPFDYFREVLQINPTDIVWPILKGVLSCGRQVARLSLHNPSNLRATALTIVWFYKCRDNAQVFIRYSDQDDRKRLWHAIREIGRSDADPFAEERDSELGMIETRHIQRNPKSFITTRVPREAFSSEVMFVFGPGLDWSCDDARRIYLIDRPVIGRSTGSE